MKKIIARQLIYTRVEENYSPTGKSGYQVFYSSPELNQQEIDYIVKKVSIFEPHSPDVIRLQCFFINSNNNVVITCTKIIDSHPEIIDKDRRQGIHVAHCLVLSMDEYKKLGFNPFLIFDSFQFVASASHLIQSYNQNEQREAIIEIPVLQHKFATLSTSWINQILELNYISSPKFINEKKTLLVYGNPIDVNETVNAIFGYIPPMYRKKLAFDTYTQENQTLLGEYWMVGLNEWKAGYSIALNASQKTFSSNPEKFVDVYTTWLQNAISQDKLNIDEISEVQTLVNLIAEKQRIDGVTISNTTLILFYDANRIFFESQFSLIVKKIVKDEIATKLIEYLLVKLSVKDLISIVALGTLSSNELNSFLCDWLVDPNNLISGDDFLYVVELSLRAKANQNLIVLSNSVQNLDNKELTSLEKLISGNNIPQTFLDAVNLHRKKLGDPHTFLNSLFGRK